MLGNLNCNIVEIKRKLFAGFYSIASPSLTDGRCRQVTFLGESINEQVSIMKDEECLFRYRRVMNHWPNCMLHVPNSHESLA